MSRCEDCNCPIPSDCECSRCRSVSAPRPPEGPDREALASVIGHALKASILFDRGNEAHRLDIAGIVADAVLALLPTPPAPGDHDPDECARHRVCYTPAPGDGEGLRAEVERLRAIRDAVMECPDDQRRELYRADLIAGQHIARAVIAEAEVERLRAALATRDTDQGAGELAEVRALAEDETRHHLRWRTSVEEGGADLFVRLDDLRAALTRATPEADRG
jgi:hypothetical protein